VQTTEEVIERGLAASSLLENPTFQSVIQSLMFECFASFTETKPADKQRREDTYNLYQGLKAIEAELNSRVQAQEQAVRTIDATNEDQDDLDGPIYIQGNTDQ
jgi:hypothetical protein